MAEVTELICHICGERFELDRVEFDEPIKMKEPPRYTFKGYSKHYLINDADGHPQETCRKCHDERRV